jgi:hypothetical protein
MHPDAHPQDTRECQRRPAADAWRYSQPWGGITCEPPKRRKSKPPPAHPHGYDEKRLIIGGIECTALWHKLARQEVAKLTRHLTPAQQRVARAFASDCTTGGHYYWSQKRLGTRASVSRQKTNAALRRFADDLEILCIPAKQRHYNGPKTLTLARWLLDRIWKALLRSLAFRQGDTRRAKPSVDVHHGSPSLTALLRRFKRKRRYGGGWMVCCPAHDDRVPSLSVSEGRRGILLTHCHAGCSHAAVRAALSLSPLRGAVLDVGRRKLNYDPLDLSTRVIDPTTTEAFTQRSESRS